MEQVLPKIRFPEFIGNWEKKKLGEISQLITKGTTPKKFINEGIKFIKLECFEGDKINGDKCLFIDENTHNKELKRSILKENDLLFAIAGATIGKVNFVTNEILPANTNQALSIIRLKEEECKNYIYQILKSDRMKRYITDSISVGAQPNLNLEQMNNFTFFYPTLVEQTKIASFLTAVDDKLQALKQKKTLLEQYKKGVMQKIFSQELRFNDDNGHEYPDWEEKKLGDIGTFQTSSIDKLSNENESEVYLVNYMNVYRHENINSESIKTFQVVTAKEKQIESCNLIKGDILFTPSSETPDDIGHSVVIFENLENAVFSYHLMRFRPTRKISILYSHYFCNIPQVLSQLTKLATGSTRFTISVKSFSSISVELPCIEEQTKIANFLSAIDDKINHCQVQLEKMEVWKKGLLQQMFC